MYCGIIYIPWGQFLWIVGFLLFSGGCNFVDAPMSYDILIPRNIEPGFNLLCDIINLGLIYPRNIEPPYKIFCPVRQLQNIYTSIYSK